MLGLGHLGNTYPSASTLQPSDKRVSPALHALRAPPPDALARACLTPRAMTRPTRTPKPWCAVGDTLRAHRR